MSDRILVATRKGLFDLTRARAGWAVDRVSFLGSPVSMMLRDTRDNTLYAALNLGHFGCKLHRSSDEGATWEEIAAPSYAGIEGDPAPDLKLIWCLETGGADEPGVLWAGTIPGGLFRSADRGSSWTLIRSLWDRPERARWFGGGYDHPGIHSICVDPRNSRHVAVAVSCGGVWESFDGGASWALEGNGIYSVYVPPGQAQDLAIQDPHRMVQCPSAPDTYWVQHHNGVFRAGGGIQAFHEITPVSPSSFGFAVAVHPKDPDTAWFAPARKDEYRYPVDGRFVVTRTRDGGKTFDQLTNGLPQREAYDLIYRHGLDIDTNGAALAMGSTTGNLWTSADGGDQWTLVNAHLPPIYAVRFP